MTTIREKEYRDFIRRTVDRATRLERCEKRLANVGKQQTTWFDVVALGACIGALVAGAIYQGWL